MSLKKIILSLIITTLLGATTGYFTGKIIGLKNPDYITRHFVPNHYINEDGTVQETSYWGVSGIYKPEVRGAEIGLFQGTIAGFWVGVIVLALLLFHEKNKRTKELESTVKKLEEEIRKLKEN